MSESSSYFDLAGRLEESFAEIEDTITVDLRENDEDYRSLYQSISDLKAKHPFIQKVIEGAGGLTLSAEYRLLCLPQKDRSILIGGGTGFSVLLFHI